MTGRHAKPTVVRFWFNGYAEPSINYLVNDWDRGTFTLPATISFSRELMDAACHGVQITVESTPEFEWTVRKVSHHQFHPNHYRVTAHPRTADQLRAVAFPDEKLIEIGWVQRAHDRIGG